MIATDSFYHGRTHYHKGDVVEVTKGESEDLQKAGLITEEDLIGGDKMAPITSNKMEKPVSNKAK